MFEQSLICRDRPVKLTDLMQDWGEFQQLLYAFLSLFKPLQHIGRKYGGQKANLLQMCYELRLVFM
ncbi:MAG: hypothetical protein GX303_06655 [Clostridiales bacterium]|nr:hypothetical protein [Clostridiales bacterium]